MVSDQKQKTNDKNNVLIRVHYKIFLLLKKGFWFDKFHGFTGCSRKDGPRLFSVDLSKFFFRTFE